MVRCNEVIQNLNSYEIWEGLIIKISDGGFTKPAIIGNIYAIITEEFK